MFTGGYSELTRNWTSNPVWGAKMEKEIGAYIPTCLTNRYSPRELSKKVLPKLLLDRA